MKRVFIFFTAVILYLNFIADLENILRERSRVSCLSSTLIQSKEFREQKLSEEFYKKLCAAETSGGNWIELLTASMIEYNFSPAKISDLQDIYMKYKPKEYETLKKAYCSVWEDVQYFPVASKDIYFDNTWLDKRDYGGKRLHEGTDLFGKISVSGYYPVISMTDGTVEKKGWLPLGGYRIGIRAPHGGYFYYAHLSGYERNFREGDIVCAGDILGYMGNTGYGEEGTKGKFPVHLHLGIYISATGQEELSVNPYWVLRNFRKKFRNYTY